jgi:hypothetical protein
MQALAPKRCCRCSHPRVPLCVLPAPCFPARSLNLTGCGLKGSIPSSFVGLNKLSLLLLAGNELNGTFPSAMVGLSTLVNLDLYGNRVSGERHMGALHGWWPPGCSSCPPSSLPVDMVGCVCVLVLPVSV